MDQFMNILICGIIWGVGFGGLFELEGISNRNLIIIIKFGGKFGKEEEEGGSDAWKVKKE